MKQIILSIALITVMSACANLPASNQTQGTVAGGAIGALIGSTIGDGRGTVWATSAGAIGGALVGSHIGKRLDQNDKLVMQKATYRALEHTKSHSKSVWNNPDSGNKGAVTPTKTLHMTDGRVCREYTSMIEVGGKAETGYGKACREDDGSWRIIS